MRLTADSVRKNLDDLITNSAKDDYASISTLVGKNHAYIQQFIKRKTPKVLSEIDRQKIAEYFNVSEWEIGGAPANADESLKGFAEDEDSGIAFVPTYDIAASSSAGCLANDKEPSDNLPFKTKWLNDLSIKNTSKLAVITVSGDSMEPTFIEGDQILVDLKRKKPTREGLFVISVSEILHIKRITLGPNGRTMNVKSDNILYDTWNNMDPDDVNVIGKVIWVSRKVN
jgi:phage repressor protein C with HTH and peptisase S24 domain